MLLIMPQSGHVSVLISTGGELIKLGLRSLASRITQQACRVENVVSSHITSVEKRLRITHRVSVTVFFVDYFSAYHSADFMCSASSF